MLQIRKQVAALVLINGKIITVDTNDSIAQAVAVKDGKIIAVGTTEEIRGYVGPETDILNLQGKTVTPGLIDAHNHLYAYGQVKTKFVSLRGTKSIGDILQRLAERIENTSENEWVLGHGFTRVVEGRPPNRWDLDNVSPNNPVFIFHASGQYGVVNSRALEMAGITEDTPDPPGGEIEKDNETGQPNGILTMYPAEDLVLSKIMPFPSTYPEFYNEQFPETREYVRYASEKYLAEGITGVHDVFLGHAPRRALWTYRTLNAREELPIRLYLMPYVRSRAVVENFLAVDRFEDSMLTFKGIKLAVDGGLAMRTMLMYEDYLSTNGISLHSQENLNEMVSMFHNAGYQISIHVVGDKAIDMALDAIESAQNVNPRENPRHRLEHLCLPTEETLQRIKTLGIVVSAQPYFVYIGGDMYENIFGEERAASMMPLKTLLNMGIPVALGSDPPAVDEYRPQWTLWAAVTRQTSQGNIIGENERLTIQEALRAHTMGSAYAAFEEDIKGSIEVGKLADMVVWSDDLYTVPTEQIRDLHVEMTFLGGRAVYVSENTNLSMHKSS